MSNFLRARKRVEDSRRRPEVSKENPQKQFSKLQLMESFGFLSATLNPETLRFDRSLRQTLKSSHQNVLQNLGRGQILSEYSVRKAKPDPALHWQAGLQRYNDPSLWSGFLTRDFEKIRPLLTI